MDTQRKRLGRNQKLAAAFLLLPFLTATSFVLGEVGGASAEWWGDFVATLVPWWIGLMAGFSALIKGSASIATAVQKRQSE